MTRFVLAVAFATAMLSSSALAQKPGNDKPLDLAVVAAQPAKIAAAKSRPQIFCGGLNAPCDNK